MKKMDAEQDARLKDAAAAVTAAARRAVAEAAAAADRCSLKTS